MHGLTLDSGHLRFRTDLPEPQPGPGEVVVQPLRAGICATDLALQNGYMGFAGIPGHEFVGVPLQGRFAGRRVVGEINAGCGACDDCRNGQQNHCARRTVLGILERKGAFAQRLTLPESNLHLVPDHVSTDAATFTEPLAAAFQIQQQLGSQLRPSMRALVCGDGKLGLLCAWVLHRHGLDVQIAGRHPQRAGLLWSGARIETDPAELARLPRFDLVVEATGRAETLGQILSLVRPCGWLVLKTTVAQPVTADLSLCVIHELQILGSRCGPFALALDALAKDQVPVEKFIAARYPLRQGEAAFAHAAQRGTLKVLLDHEVGG